jgi:hypothetical protein
MWWQRVHRFVSVQGWNSVSIKFDGRAGPENSSSHSILLVDCVVRLFRSRDIYNEYRMSPSPRIVEDAHQFLPLSL